MKQGFSVAPPDGKRSSYFSNHVILTTGTNLLLAALALVSGSMVARLLGPTGRGELAAIQTWAAFLALLASLGLPDAVVYFSSRRPERSAVFLVSAISAMLVAAIPFVAAGYLLLPGLLSAQSADTIATGRQYLVMFVLLMATQGMLLHPLRGRQDFLAWNLLRVLYAVLWIAALLALSIAALNHPGSVAGAYLVSLACGALVAVFILRRRVPGPYRPDPRMWRPMLKFGIPLAGSSLPQMLNLRLDQLLMAAFLPAALLGQYAVAVAWSGAMAPILQGLGSVLFPRVASQHSREDQIALLATGARVTMLIGTLAGIALLVVTAAGIRIVFGAPFAPAIPSALILVVAGIIAGLNGVLEEGARGLNAPSIVLWAELAGLFGTAVGLFALLRPLGIVGAALASVAGYIVTLIVLALGLCRLSGLNARALLVPTSAEVQALRRALRQAISVGMLALQKARTRFSGNEAL